MGSCIVFCNRCVDLSRHPQKKDERKGGENFFIFLQKRMKREGEIFFILEFLSYFSH
jgi:hypothetical protein